MSTQTMPIAGQRRQQTNDRRFYLAMAGISALLIFVGFSRSYYLRPLFFTTPALSLLVHIHGAVFTVWILYFLVQTTLIAVKRPSLHRKLGLTGAFLGSAMILLGLAVAFTAMRLRHGTATQSPEVIFLTGLVDIGTFAAFFITGYLKRRDRDAHQRLMLLAIVLGLTGPALGRLLTIGVPVPALSIINLSLIFAGPMYDFITRRRIHPVYIYGALWALLTFTPLRFVVGATPWWHRAAHFLAGM